MKNARLRLLALALMMTLQSAAAAPMSRTDGMGEQEIIRAQRELAIIRHDLLRLKAALNETEAAILRKQSQVKSTDLLSIGAATAGLSLAALAATTTQNKSKFVAAMITLQTALSITMGVLSQVDAQDKTAASADNAVIKARQEILALRASGTANDDVVQTLLTLDHSLNGLQSSLEDYRDAQTLKKRIHIAAIISQTAGAAMSLGLTIGFMQNPMAPKNGAFITSLLIASGNLANLIQEMTPAKTKAVLEEIALTRTAVDMALASLN